MYDGHDMSTHEVIVRSLLEVLQEFGEASESECEVGSFVPQMVACVDCRYSLASRPYRQCLCVRDISAVVYESVWTLRAQRQKCRCAWLCTLCAIAS